MLTHETSGTALRYNNDSFWALGVFSARFVLNTYLRVYCFFFLNGTQCLVFLYKMRFKT